MGVSNISQSRLPFCVLVRLFSILKPWPDLVSCCGPLVASLVLPPSHTPSYPLSFILCLTSTPACGKLIRYLFLESYMRVLGRIRRPDTSTLLCTTILIHCTPISSIVIPRSVHDEKAFMFRAKLSSTPSTELSSRSTLFFFCS